MNHAGLVNCAPISLVRGADAVKPASVQVYNLYERYLAHMLR